MSKIFGPYYRKDGKLQTKSYPKYLLEQKLGRELMGEETCDHVDENFQNDDINNLQILTRAQNVAKARIGFKKAIYYFICPTCHKPASKELHDVKGNWKQGSSGPYCSRECGAFGGRGYTVHETTYEFDPITKEVIVTSNSWEIDWSIVLSI